ncbi:kinesin-like protein KIF20A isoform X1 [Nerophis ophidion]|uniref:kinesin-like protein KIF20A isoform X1 n=1 Tax=Nerophis ophidion TaxID=159077 RepID=UPI002ADFF519|nr:kinesin-like protein KIF20A isoform X1 [Nerophis ophidion]
MTSQHLDCDDMELTCLLAPVDSLPKKAEAPAGADPQTMKVYLRVRPFSKEELSDNEDQHCVVIENDQMVTLQAPRGSASMKNSEKGVGMSIHKFSFSKILGPATSQSELYDDVISGHMTSFLHGDNSLIFSYGVTNAGKTFTIQGSAKQPGILPRVLHTTFKYISGHQYDNMDFKPHFRNDVQHLSADQVKQERNIKAAILASFKEEFDPQRNINASDSSCVTQLSLANNDTEFSGTLTESTVDFALWVSFFEIYNESVYDLLQPSFCSKSKKRAALRVCDDGAGNAYVKDLRWINIQALDEACKLLHLGNKNRSATATKMNQLSSRSHSIFSLKLLRIERNMVTRMSEFSLCDLAGSERCNKTKTFGERLKEAGNINNSLHILGKCIMALRNNQIESRMRSSYIPFRESKLTKLFQAVFCGKGRASMIVNINQCASTYDETLHVMKFSAVAKQVVQVIPDKPVGCLSPSLVGPDFKALVKNVDKKLERGPSEDELLNDGDEADMSLLPQNELLNAIESLKTKLHSERRRNLQQEMEIRQEMGDAMLQQLMESEELRSQQIEELKESYQEKLESTFEMYKDAIKEHAYKSAMNNLEDNYVPLEDFIAEQDKVEALKRQLALLPSVTSQPAVTSVHASTQTLQSKDFEATDDRLRRLHKEKTAIEIMCEDKQQLILSLERRLMELSETLQKVRDNFLEKSAELEDLQVKTRQQTTAMEEVLCQCVEQDKEINSLKAEISTFANLPVQVKSKKGLLANIREVVTSPRNTSSVRLLRSVRTQHR